MNYPYIFETACEHVVGRVRVPVALEATFRTLAFVLLTSDTVPAVLAFVVGVARIERIRA